jgi:hypothetical protein
MTSLPKDNIRWISIQVLIYIRRIQRNLVVHFEIDLFKFTQKISLVAAVVYFQVKLPLMLLYRLYMYAVIDIFI